MNIFSIWNNSLTIDMVTSVAAIGVSNDNHDIPNANDNFYDNDDDIILWSLHQYFYVFLAQS